MVYFAQLVVSVMENVSVKALNFFCKMPWNNILLLLCQEIADSFDSDFSTEGQIWSLVIFVIKLDVLYIQSQTEVCKGNLFLDS